MKAIFCIIIMISLQNNCFSSYYTNDIKFLPMVDHLLQEWDPADELSKELHKELAGKDSTDILDIISTVCWLCSPEDSIHNKVSLALTFAAKPASDRSEIARMALAIKKYHQQENNTNPVVDIVWALYSVPSYQRPAIYDNLRQPASLTETNLFIYARRIAENMGYTDLARLYFHHNLIRPIALMIWPIESIQKSARLYGRTSCN